MTCANEAVRFGENLENIAGWGFHPNNPFNVACYEQIPRERE
ncbi:MAG: hypothetical protein ACI4CY_08150 [Candidatus Gastranaerophilaceae bacterium]